MEIPQIFTQVQEGLNHKANIVAAAPLVVASVWTGYLQVTLTVGTIFYVVTLGIVQSLIIYEKIKKVKKK